MPGDGVPNMGTEKVFEPLSGDLAMVVTFSSHGNLSRTQWNGLRAAALNAGGMTDPPAAYLAIKSGWDTIQSGRGAWLDRQTAGANSTETGLLQRGVVWHFAGQNDVPSPPQP